MERRRANISRSIGRFTGPLTRYGFGLVTGADIFWDLMSWLVFCLVCDTMEGYIFFAAIILIKVPAAISRH